LKLSPSQIEAFDPDTTWGCNRAWWFKYVQKIQGPPDASQQLGTDVHAQIEHYIKTGQNVLGKIAMSGKAIIDGIKLLNPVIEGDISYPFGEDLMRGRVDVRLVSPPRIVDWKTTSSIEKYAKTPGDLRKNTQMLIYADWHRKQNGVIPSLMHVYFQTKGNVPAVEVLTHITEEQLDTGIARIKKLVEQIHVVAEQKTVQEITPNLRACDVGRGCPFRHVCPRYEGVTTVASLLEKFKTKAPDAPPPQIVKADLKPPIFEPKERVKLADVLPPDAPKSDPAKAAEPLPTKIEAPPPPPPITAPDSPRAPKRGPGRPKKDSEPTQPPAKAEGPAVGIKIHTVTVMHESKINLGNYQMHTVQASVTAEVGTDTIAKAIAAVSEQVKAQLLIECQPFLGPSK
jgi:hypothetical protein